jgi:hypothetical protein
LAAENKIGTFSDMAKGFREITGVAFKTPGALCWLIKHRQWIHGRINQLEKILKAAPEELDRLRGQLAAIDTTMQLHEIQVDPTLLKPVRKKRPRLAPYGALTRFILTYLRRNRGTSHTTLQVTLYVLNELKLDVTRKNQSRVRRAVISQLNTLRSNGFVTGTALDRNADRNGEASWRLTEKRHQARPPQRGR